jgi:transcriptional regulator TrmB
VVPHPEPDRPELRQLGLSADEATTYLALLRQPGSAASELAPLTGLGTETIARTLAALEAAGLAERGAARDDGYHPMPPDLAFESVLLERARQRRPSAEPEPAHRPAPRRHADDQAGRPHPAASRGPGHPPGLAVTAARCHPAPRPRPAWRAPDGGLAGSAVSPDLA